MILQKLFEVHDTDKKLLGYAEAYETYFAKFRYEPITFLEMGVNDGRSLLVWRDYFPNATIVGIDSNRLPENLPDRIFTHNGEQQDQHFINDIIVKYGGFDIVVDDCSHIWSYQQKSFEYLWKPGVKSGGVYAIEDLGTSFMQQYSYDSDIDTADYLAILTRELLADAQRQSNMKGIHFYPNLCIMEKR